MVVRNRGILGFLSQDPQFLYYFHLLECCCRIKGTSTISVVKRAGHPGVEVEYISHLGHFTRDFEAKLAKEKREEATSFSLEEDSGVL
jgi:hypothetical protein